MDSVAEVLNQTADHIAAFGHHKGAGYASVGGFQTAPCCIIGGIHAVETDGLLRTGAVDAMSRHLEPINVVTFNDAPSTTPEQVIEALRAAAAIEESRESELVPSEVTR